MPVPRGRGKDSGKLVQGNLGKKEGVGCIGTGLRVRFTTVHNPTSYINKYNELKSN